MQKALTDLPVNADYADLEMLEIMAFLETLSPSMRFATFRGAQLVWLHEAGECTAPPPFVTPPRARASQ